eukprot:scaffold147994_cov27-Prasinocladus_malaysianus.AAC.1
MLWSRLKPPDTRNSVLRLSYTSSARPETIPILKELATMAYVSLGLVKILGFTHAGILINA